jgi:hypothetical protein
MINIKSLFITTSISLIFGVYSIYNILDFMRLMNRYHVKQIDILEYQINDSDKKYNEINKKHIDLQKIYNELLDNYECLKKEVKLLNFKIIEINKNNNNDNSDFSIDKHEINSKDNLFCDKLCDLNHEIPRLNLNTMTKESSFISEEFEESLSIVYKNNENINILSKNISNQDFPNKTRTRSYSISDINWKSISKKFIFG